MRHFIPYRLLLSFDLNKVQEMKAGIVYVVIKVRKLVTEEAEGTKGQRLVILNPKSRKLKI